MPPAVTPTVSGQTKGVVLPGGSHPRSWRFGRRGNSGRILRKRGSESGAFSRTKERGGACSTGKRIFLRENKMKEILCLGGKNVRFN